MENFFLPRGGGGLGDPAEVDSGPTPPEDSQKLLAVMAELNQSGSSEESRRRSLFK